ncbi:MAG: alpha/beta hydrolase [Acidobacteria bacterium]|nr:alpha/beta hydrolase [Acidobacteriota bacterium]
MDTAGFQFAIFDQGAGDPLLVIPGLQGRWEWMQPALTALSRHYRVISYSLCGDIGSRMRMDPALGFDVFVRQVDRVMARAGVERMAICGVSYGGVIALRYAALNPERVTALILANTPGPGWTPDATQARYVANPWLTFPAFCVAATRRLGRELSEGLPDWPSRAGFILGQLVNVITAPAIPGLMARRVRLLQQTTLAPDCARIAVPTLVVTGAEHLDLVVPVSSTREYLRLIPHAAHVSMDDTGHLGSLTQPERFTGIVKEFLARHS